MNRRDFFGATVTHIATAISSTACCGDNIEALFTNKLQPCIDSFQELETNLRKTIGELKTDAAACTNRVKCLSKSVTAISKQLKRTEHQQLLIFVWLLALTIVTGVDMLTFETFYIFN